MYCDCEIWILFARIKIIMRKNIKLINDWKESFVLPFQHIKNWSSYCRYSLLLQEMIIDDKFQFGMLGRWLRCRLLYQEHTLNVLALLFLFTRHAISKMHQMVKRKFNVFTKDHRYINAGGKTDIFLF